VDTPKLALVDEATIPPSELKVGGEPTKPSRDLLDLLVFVLASLDFLHDADDGVSRFEESEGVEVVGVGGRSEVGELLRRRSRVSRRARSLNQSD
jgi:hypothetical protein